MMVETSVTSAITVHQTLVLVTAVSFGIASLRAFPARVRPMIIATGPVTEAGKMVSTAFLPQKRTKRPAAMDTKPERMIPNCAY